MIEIEAGKNFIRNRVYYFSFAGEPILNYDLELGTVEWSFQGNIKKITVKNAKQVGFFPQEQRIFIICSCGKQELLGYDIEGKYLFKTNNPSEFEMLYFAKLRDNIMIVCDDNKNK